MSLPLTSHKDIDKSSAPSLPTGGDVLVINASHEMAKEITMELALSLPGCAITYAPSIEIALFILRGRDFGLVVSSSILPDGPCTRLSAFLEELASPPTLLIVGRAHRNASPVRIASRYRIQSVQRASIGQPNRVMQKKDIVRSLGQDLRNDLNNPLQEIVAMVFVAQANQGSQTNSEALGAIDRAAKNLASVVHGIESKIRSALGP